MFCVELPLLEFVRLVSPGFSTKVSPLCETADLGPACWVMVSRRTLAQVATCGEATKPGPAPNGSLNGSLAGRGLRNRTISAKWHFHDGVNLRNLQIQNVSEVSKGGPQRWQESFALQTKREELAKQQQPSISLGQWLPPDRKRSS